jgi:peptidoglycan/xylan/chitin deacetylase (PgdA/CDA1 family)
MKSILALASLVLGGVAVFGAAQAQVPAWPGGRKAAIALTYDDALASQLDVAIPQLDATGLKGTFFLAGRQVGGNVTRWRAAAASGHELGNHTINHPCGKASYDTTPQYTSEAYTVETLLAEVGVMNAFLEAIDGRKTHSFATPCVQNLAGGQDYLGPLAKAGLAPHVRDSRTTPGLEGKSFIDATGAEMIAWAEGLRRSGAAGFIIFHGVGGDYLSVSADAHKQLVDYLKAHDAEIWTTTFSELMQAVGR